MKRMLLLLVIAGGVFSVVGCLKNDDDYKPCVERTIEDDMPAMAKFAAHSSINTTQDGNGLLYQIIEPGTGATPTASSTVIAKYVGRTLDGKGFDSSYVRDPAGTEFPLNGVIRGWTLGISKIKEGGKIKLIIPSSLAYGCALHPLQNKPLYFYVELVKVK